MSRPARMPRAIREARGARHAPARADGTQATVRADAVLENLALSLFSGILLAVPFVLPQLWWMHYLALVPWVVLITREQARRTWPYFLAGAYTFFIMALGPSSLFHKAVPFVLGLWYAPFLLPFAFVLRPLRRRLALPFTLLVPVAWVATEWLRVRFSIGAAALFPLGASQFSRTNLIQIVDVTGVYGLSFLVAAGSGALVDVWHALHSAGRGDGWRLSSVIPVACYPLLMLAVLWYGVARQRSLSLDPAGPRLAVVQPNAVHYRDSRRAFETYEQQDRFTRGAITPGSADIIAWPENAIGEPFSDDPRYLESLRLLARNQAAHVLVGSFTRDAALPDRLVRTSAYYLAPDGTIEGRYDKMHLLPWAEYIPFGGWLGQVNAGLATSLLGYMARGMPGRELTLFPITTEAGVMYFAVPICFEVSSTGFAREAASKGARFLVNITSEGMLGPPIYVHMLSHSVLRAVENRLAVVRVANNGLSGFVDPVGRVHLITDASGGWLFRGAGTLLARVPVKAGGSGTLYTRYGDWLAYLCVGATLFGLALTFVRMRPRTLSAPLTDSRP